MGLKLSSRSLLSISMFPSVLLPLDNYGFDKTASDRGQGPPVIGWEDTSGPTEQWLDGKGSTLACDDGWLTADAEVVRGHGKEGKWRAQSGRRLPRQRLPVPWWESVWIRAVEATERAPKQCWDWRLFYSRILIHTEVPLKSSIGRNGRRAPSISVKKRGEEYLRIITEKQYPRRQKRHPFNLTSMKTRYLRPNHLHRVYIHIYQHKVIPTSRCTIQYYFPQHRWEGWEERREDERVLRALFSLSLYQLSSLKPSESVNHKRVQSLGDILFSPSLNTLYHNPRPTQLHSLLHLLLHPAVAGAIYLQALIYINIQWVSGDG